MKPKIINPRIWFATIVLLLSASLAAAQDVPLFRWENFTTANGLPDNHVFCVLVDGDTRLGRHGKRIGPLRKRRVESLSPRRRLRNCKASRTRPCSRSRSTSAPATCGPAPWAG